MVQGNAKLVVDLGNSETRVKTLYGRTAKGTPRSRLKVLSNRFARVPAGMVESIMEGDVYSPEDSYLFSLNGEYYCNGRVCLSEFAQRDMAPSAIEKKYDSFVTKLAIINALREGIQSVAEMSSCTVDNLDITWELYLLLPPEDVSLGAKKIDSVARSITELDFSMPEIKCPINISGVKVLPEGLCAFIGTAFQNKGTVRSGYAGLLDPTKSTLVVDMGAGTTDFLLVRGASIVKSSMFTKPIGGNNIVRIVQRALNAKGLALPVNIVSDGCQSGYVTVGSKRIPIVDEVVEAKKAVSQQLVTAIQGFFEVSMLDIMGINNILVCGGGAEAPEDETGIEPISNYILSYIKQLNSYIELIEIPSIRVGESLSPLSPRMLNIIGAGVLAE